MKLREQYRQSRKNRSFCKASTAKVDDEDIKNLIKKLASVPVLAKHPAPKFNIVIARFAMRMATF